MGSAQSAGGEQERDAGNGQAKLLHQHPEEKDGVGMTDEELDGNRHGRGSSVVDEDRPRLDVD